MNIDLKKLRERQFKTLQMVADEVGVSTMTVHRWEEGKRRPALRFIPKLARALDVDPQELLEKTR